MILRCSQEYCSSSNNFKAGDKVTGSVSGATGIVAYEDASNNHVMFMMLWEHLQQMMHLHSKEQEHIHLIFNTFCCKKFQCRRCKKCWSRNIRHRQKKTLLLMLQLDSDKLLSGVASITLVVQSQD